MNIKSKSQILSLDEVKELLSGDDSYSVEFLNKSKFYDADTLETMTVDLIRINYNNGRKTFSTDVYGCTIELLFLKIAHLSYREGVDVNSSC